MVRTSGHSGCSRAYLKFSKTADNTSIRNAALPLPSRIVFPSSSTSLNSFREQHTLPVRVLMRTPLINWSLMLHDTQNKGSVCSLLFCRFIDYFYLFMCLCLCIVMCKCPRRPGENVGPPGAWVQAAVSCLAWVLGTELRLSARAAAKAPSSWATSPPSPDFSVAGISWTDQGKL